MYEQDHETEQEHGSKRSGGHVGHGGLTEEEHHEGAPEWLISFADMVMLMMGFFVILFALNNNPAGRQPGGSAPDDSGYPANSHMLDLALAIRKAFHNPVDIMSTKPQEQELVRRLRQRAGISEARDRGTSGADHDVRSIRPSDYYAFSGTVPFFEDSFELNDIGLRTIREIAEKARGLRVVVEVRGHVSSVEAQGGPVAAMELSWKRSMAVAKNLADQGVDWWQIRLVESADHDRIDPHPASRAADRANARVEIVLTDQVIPDEVPTVYADDGTP